MGLFMLQRRKEDVRLPPFLPQKVVPKLKGLFRLAVLYAFMLALMVLNLYCLYTELKGVALAHPNFLFSSLSGFTAYMGCGTQDLHVSSANASALNNSSYDSTAPLHDPFKLNNNVPSTDPSSNPSLHSSALLRDPFKLNLSLPATDSSSNSLADSSSNPSIDSSSTVSASSELELPKEKCNFAEGEWVPDPEGPLYTNETCHFIQSYQNCLKHGRPDRGYLHWRWKPNNCELKKFDPILFLHMMRGKKMAFVGDSIARTQMQALLCTLTQVEVPYSLFENEDHENVDHKDTRWHFPAHNFTLSQFWAPFLVKYKKEPLEEDKDKIRMKLQLDVPEESWGHALPEYQVAIFSAGPWFLNQAMYYENNTLIGCINCPEDDNVTRVDDFFYGFKAAFETVLKYVTTLPGYTGISMLRTITVDHFENGSWASGGTCNRKVPYTSSQGIQLPWLSSEYHNIQVSKFKKYANGSAPNGSKMKLLDATQSAFLRPDGHPGRYRPDGQRDCLHFCIPGPVDAWNEMALNVLEED